MPDDTTVPGVYTYTVQLAHPVLCFLFCYNTVARAHGHAWTLIRQRVALGVVARTLEASEMRNLEQEFHKVKSRSDAYILLSKVLVCKQ